MSDAIQTDNRTRLRFKKKMSQSVFYDKEFSYFFISAKKKLDLNVIQLSVDVTPPDKKAAERENYFLFRANIKC